MPPGAGRDTKELITTLGEKHVIPILEATMEEAVSARTIIEDHDVPRTTFYRRIDRLLELGLVEEHGEVALDGSHHTTYRCNIEEIRIRVVDGELETEIERRISATDRWIGAWSDLKGDRA